MASKSNNNNNKNNNNNNNYGVLSASLVVGSKKTENKRKRTTVNLDLSFVGGRSWIDMRDDVYNNFVPDKKELFSQARARRYRDREQLKEWNRNQALSSLSQSRPQDQQQQEQSRRKEDNLPVCYSHVQHLNGNRLTKKISRRRPKQRQHLLPRRYYSVVVFFFLVQSVTVYAASYGYSISLSLTVAAATSTKVSAASTSLSWSASMSTTLLPQLLRCLLIWSSLPRLQLQRWHPTEMNFIVVAQQNTDTNIGDDAMGSAEVPSPAPFTPTPVTTFPPSTTLPPTTVPTTAQPTTTRRPTVSPIPTQLPTDSPTFHPTTSFRPSSVPSASPKPSVTPVPTFAPTPVPTVTRVPTQSPSAYPSAAPSSLPSQAPTVSLVMVNQTGIKMQLEGMLGNWTRSDFAIWAGLTSEYIRIFWEDYDHSPYYVSNNITTRVSSATKMQAQTTIPNQNVVMDPNNPQISTTSVKYDSLSTRTAPPVSTIPGTPGFRPRPMLIEYNQTIHFGITDYVLADSPVFWPAIEKLFIMPFQVNQQVYTAMLASRLNVSPPVYVSFVRLATTQNSLLPPTATTARNKKDQNIIIISIMITAFSLIVAGGYIFYLMQKGDDEEGVAGDQGVNGGNRTQPWLHFDDYTDDYYGDNDEEMYRRNTPENAGSRRSGSRGGASAGGTIQSRPKNNGGGSGGGTVASVRSHASEPPINSSRHKRGGSDGTTHSLPTMYFDSTTATNTRRNSGGANSITPLPPEVVSALRRESNENERGARGVVEMPQDNSIAKLTPLSERVAFNPGSLVLNTLPIAVILDDDVMMPLGGDRDQNRQLRPPQRQHPHNNALPEVDATDFGYDSESSDVAGASIAGHHSSRREVHSRSDNELEEIGEVVGGKIETTNDLVGTQQQKRDDCPPHMLGFQMTIEDLDD